MNLIVFQEHALGSVTRRCKCGREFKAAPDSRAKTCPKCIYQRRRYAASIRWMGLKEPIEPFEMPGRSDERDPSEDRTARATPLWATTVRVPDIVDDDLVTPSNPHGTDYVAELEERVNRGDPKLVPTNA